MNKRLAAILAFSSMALASCVDTEQLYARDAYLGGTYVGHEYNVWEGQTKKAYQERLVYETVLENEEHGYFCGSGNSDTVSQCYGAAQAKSRHPEWFKTKDGQDLYWGYNDGHVDIINAGAGVYVDNSPLYDTIYSQNKRLDRFYEKFSRGYLSKLYNGQIKCNGWSYYAMAVISDEGFGTMFPYELSSAEYFATSLLISTDDETNDPGTRGRIVTVTVHTTFYKYDEKGELVGYKVTMPNMDLSCNAGAALTSLVGFTFADAGIDPKGIVGMSFTWDLVNDDHGCISNFKEEGKHDGLSVYEVLFPDSTWF